jgi:uncharacterized protein YjbJ (UPF0337 family)
VDEQHVKGAADTIKGAVKDKAKGSVRNVVGDAKDAVKDADRR